VIDDTVVKAIDGTKIEIPKKPRKRASAYEKRKATKRFRRRAGIDPIIGHLKFDNRLLRNYLKGSVGDSINLMMAAAAYNFKKLMRQLLEYLRSIFLALNSQISKSIPIAIVT
jgi:IS5 family transposase